MLTLASRSEKADFAVQVLGDRIEGWMSWDVDELFRPTIGIFVDDVLTRLVPTFRFRRENPDGTTTQPCRFEITDLDTASLAAASSLTISCVETCKILYMNRPASSAKESGLAPTASAGTAAGMIESLIPANSGLKRLFRQVASPLSVDQSPDIIDVEAILDAGRRGKRAFGHGGFLRFLSLPLLDQLNILYLDLLDRGVDPGAASDVLKRVTVDGVTILDVRDEILGSREFWSRGPFSPDMPIGAWCSWDGLNDLDPSSIPSLGPQDALLTTDGAVLRSYVSLAASDGRLSRHLARIALGHAAAEQDVVKWCRSHFQVVCTFDAQLADEPAINETSSRGGGNPMLRNVLSAMSIGKAGRRVEDTIRNQPGRSGHLTFGPYLKLPAGVHRISLGYRATVEPGTTPPATLSLEVVCSDVLFARRDVSIDASTAGTVDLDFLVPDAAHKLTQDSGFEFRIAVDGRSDIAIESMTFTQNVDVESEVSYPNVADWLAAMSVGPMASRTASGEIEYPAKAASGFVMFGPYVKLLPGQYQLTVQITCDAPGRSAKPLTIEVIEPAGLVASAPIPLSAGVNEVVLPFAVTQVANLAGLRGPMEFRLRSDAGTGFRVSGLTVVSE